MVPAPVVDEHGDGVDDQQQQQTQDDNLLHYAAYLMCQTRPDSILNSVEVPTIFSQYLEKEGS